MPPRPPRACTTVLWNKASGPVIWLCSPQECPSSHLQECLWEAGNLPGLTISADIWFGTVKSCSGQSLSRPQLSLRANETKSSAKEMTAEVCLSNSTPTTKKLFKSRKKKPALSLVTPKKKGQGFYLPYLRAQGQYFQAKKPNLPQ